MLLLAVLSRQFSILPYAFPDAQMYHRRLNENYREHNYVPTAIFLTFFCISGISRIR